MNIYKLYISLLLILVLTFTGFAQAQKSYDNRILAGYVLDINQNPLSNSLIQAQQLAPCPLLTLGTYVNINGRFEINVRGQCDYILTATSSGHTFSDNNILIPKYVDLEDYYFIAD